MLFFISKRDPLKDCFWVQIYQHSDARVKPRTARWEARTLPLCYAVARSTNMMFVPVGLIKNNLNESLRTQSRWKKLRRLNKTCFFVPRWSKSLYVHLIQYLPQEADFLRKLNLKPASKNSSPQFSVGFGINAGSIELYQETYTWCYYVEDCILCLERCWYHLLGTSRVN